MSMVATAQPPAKKPNTKNATATGRKVVGLEVVSVTEQSRRLSGTQTVGISSGSRPMIVTGV